MAERIKQEIERTVGLDVGDRWSQLCVLGQESGEIVEEGRVRTRAEALSRRFRGPRMRVVLEVGCQSPWISRLLSSLGHEVLVANARRVALEPPASVDPETDAPAPPRPCGLDPLRPPLPTPGPAHRSDSSDPRHPLPRSARPLA